MNPFFVALIEDLKLFRRPIRDIDFGCFAQIFFGIFLNESKVGIFHGKKNIVFVVSKDNIHIHGFIVEIEGKPGGQPKRP